MLQSMAPKPTSDLRALMRYRDARLYLLALAPTLFGDTAMLLVAGVWAMELTGNGSAAAMAAFCLWAPSLLSPLFGLAADRFQRLRLLVAVNSGLALWILLLLAVHDGADVWLLFTVLVGCGVAYAVTDPAESALFADLVPPEALGGLNAVRVALQESCKLLAPAAGVALFAWQGPGPVVVLDALTFAVAAALMSRLRISGRPPRPRASDEGPWAGVTAGLRYVACGPDTRRTLLCSAAGMLVLGMAASVTFAVVDEGLRRPPSFLGVLGAVLGAASIAGGLLAPAVLRRLGERLTVAAGLAVMAVSVAVTAVPWLPAVVAGNVLRGAGMPLVPVAAITLLQRRAPEELRGRVLAAASFALNVPVTVALALGAGLMAVVDYRLLLAGMAVLCAVAAGAAGGGSARAVVDELEDPVGDLLDGDRGQQHAGQPGDQDHPAVLDDADDGERVAHGQPQHEVDDRDGRPDRRVAAEPVGVLHREDDGDDRAGPREQRHTERDEGDVDVLGLGGLVGLAGEQVQGDQQEQQTPRDT